MQAPHQAIAPTKAATEEFYALVEIDLKRARGLPKMDLNGEADPFCVVKLGDRACYKSKIVYKTRNPVWSETCGILIPESEKGYPFTIDVWDWDKVSTNDFIGTVTLDLQSYYQSKSVAGFFPIELHKKKKNKTKTKARGEIELSIRVLFKEEVERQFWQGIFDFFDIDKSGRLTSVELEGLLEGIESAMTTEDVEALFEKLDTDKNDSITFDELFAFITDPANKDEPLLAKLLPTDKYIFWRAAANGSDKKSIGTAVLSNWHSHLTWGGERRKKKAAKIMVHDRESGQLVEEKIPGYIKVAMRLMYSTGSGRMAVDSKKIRGLLHKMTVNQGKKFDSTSSVKDIEPFIEFHNLNRGEMLESEFSTFNEFFYRKLKADARPIASPQDPKVAVSPADCRLNVFPTIAQAKELWIKGHHFTLESLLQDSDLAAKYENGSLVIARLAPQDYHRFHIPVNGTWAKQPPVPIDGTYYTVNPVAVNESIDVYSNNKRIVTTIDSPEFGQVVFVAIGATMVGSICLTATPGQQVQKGDEAGYFAFGGSTVLLIFPPDSITFDHDLVVNSSKPIETLVKMGNSIGVAKQ
jgi:phosphatidylserine decarboxylase